MSVRVQLSTTDAGGSATTRGANKNLPVCLMSHSAIMWPARMIVTDATTEREMVTTELLTIEFD